MDVVVSLCLMGRFSFLGLYITMIEILIDT
jgi:hypothetical protein